MCYALGMAIVLRPGQPFEELVAAGNTACPHCQGPLSRWGWARPRVVRRPDGERKLRPHRAWCRTCGVTQVVLPPESLVRRRDAAAVVGRAWRSSAAGAGARRVARQLGVPMETARGWLRRLRALLAARYGGPADAHRDRLQRGLTAVLAEAARAGCRAEDDVWAFVAFRSQGLLLANTNWP